MFMSDVVRQTSFFTHYVSNNRTVASNNCYVTSEQRQCCSCYCGPVTISDVAYVLQLKMVLIKCCDISNEVRPFEVSEPWVDCLLEEYFNQVCD